VTAPTTGGSDPVIAAAGDIACDPASNDFNGGSGGKFNCHEQATSNILVSAQLAAVLPLGDTQYEDGATRAFSPRTRQLGRLKPISHPVVGNHEYEHGSHGDGYYRYFGTAAGDPSRVTTVTTSAAGT